MADVSIAERKSKTQKSPKLPKKRTRNPEEWHKQKQKRLRIAGKEHINTNGKLVPEKKPGPDCHCRRHCFQRVPEQVRLKTFDGFYSLKTHDEQNAYLFGLMRQIDIKRKRKKDSSRRTCTFEYFVRVRGRETQVCQNAFKNIHAITERKIRVLCKKMDDGVMFPSDNRGKNSGNRAGEVRLSAHIIEQIKEHIFSIVHTHRLRDYIRIDKVTGLEINISKMWKDYTKLFDPDYAQMVLSKGKKPLPQIEQPTNTIIQNTYNQEIPGPSTNETFHSLTYPGSGHLINLAENYFAQAMVTQTQYPTQHLSVGNYIQTDKVSYYQQPLVVQPGPGAHPDGVHSYVILQSMPSVAPELIKQESMEAAKNKEAKQKKRGPTVKQWRYTSIFHEEINGAALTAIKTRLANYFSEAESNKKKNKSTNKLQVMSMAVPQQAAVQSYKPSVIETNN